MDLSHAEVSFFVSRIGVAVPRSTSSTKYCNFSIRIYNYFYINHKHAVVALGAASSTPAPGPDNPPTKSGLRKGAKAEWELGSASYSSSHPFFSCKF